ncbi:PREDICTED: uncharacterized protein LOC109169295 [Ipomoea nil]|uniref:uncharacterized protein LOC109169295 n=1 Tax=Ipomoea nil TaxID=35883 RepID=UPI000900FD93|nr:PREDICTED: uncharacterized protein LOC109169295 [Ipomoea nil]
MRFKDICRDQVQDTFDHLYYTFKTAGTRTGTGTGIWCWKRTSRQKACECLIKEGCSTSKKSVLPKAVDLAREMNRRCSADPEAGKQFWGGLSEVWVGLLVYASSHCRGDVYYLNKGGQFYTFVRLLMAHFGLRGS